MAAGTTISRGSLFVTSQIIRRYASAVTLATGDLVNVQNGALQIADAGERIAGQILESATSATTDAQVNITPGLVVVMDNDNVSATFSATSVGEYFDIAGATGAQVIDTSSTVAPETTSNSAQMVCLEFNPQGVGFDDDLSIGTFMIKEHQYFGF